MTVKELDNLKKGDIIRYVWRVTSSVENFLIKLSAPTVKKIVLGSDTWIVYGQIIYTYRGSDNTLVRLEFGPESVSIGDTERELSNVYKTIARNNFKLKTGIVAGIFTDDPEIEMTQKEIGENRRLTRR